MPSDNATIVDVLDPKEVIGQAIDALMDGDGVDRDGVDRDGVDRDGVDRDAAVEQLVEGSSNSHRRVREVAAEIVQQRKGE